MANFKVTLSDGSIIDDLTLNGNNFISQTEVTLDMFDGKLAHVVIEGPDGADDAGLIGEHEHMELVRCQKDDALGGWAFVIRDIPAEKLEKLRDRGDIEYIAMMTGVEL